MFKSISLQNGSKFFISQILMFFSEEKKLVSTLWNIFLSCVFFLIGTKLFTDLYNDCMNAKLLSPFSPFPFFHFPNTIVHQHLLNFLSIGFAIQKIGICCQHLLCLMPELGGVRMKWKNLQDKALHTAECWGTVLFLHFPPSSCPSQHKANELLSALSRGLLGLHRRVLNSSGL